MEKFQLTSTHLLLLQQVYVEPQNSSYSLVPEIDSKMPFGNSDWEEDMREITKKPLSYEDCENLMKELSIALQIVLCTCSFIPGVYVLKDKYNSRSWVLETSKDSESPESSKEKILQEMKSLRNKISEKIREIEDLIEKTQNNIF